MPNPKNDWVDGDKLPALDYDALVNLVIGHTDAIAALTAESLGFIDITTYGAIGDGSTDNTTAIQNAIDAASAAYLPVYVPSGQFCIGSTITLPTGMQIFGGLNSGHSDVQELNTVSCISSLYTNTTPLITIPDNNRDIHIRNLHLTGSPSKGTPHATYGIYLEDDNAGDDSGVFIDKVVINRVSLDCIYIGVNRQGAKVRDCTLLWSGRDGVSINASDCGVDTTRIGTMARYGIYVNGVVARVTNGDMWGCLVGVYANNGCSIFNNGIDRNLHEGMYITAGSNGISIIGNYFHSNSQTSNGGYSHINAPATTAALCATVVGNTFGSDSTGKDPQYCINLGSGAGIKAYGNVVQTDTYTTGFSNSVTNNW